MIVRTSTCLAAAALMAATSACALMASSTGRATPAQMIAARSWRAIATDADQRRIHGWREAWDEALSAARADGHTAEIAAEGRLLEPDAALTGPGLADGDYACRTIKLGSQIAGGLSYVTYPAFTCRIRHDHDKLTFTKLSGSQRPVGVIFPDGPRNLVFLGSLALGDERGAFDYGTDPQRDMIGIVERVDEHRWRLVIPHPQFESLLDVIELVPR